MASPDVRLPGIWFPAVRRGTGADVFTARLCSGLLAQGMRAEICWLPPRAEYLPWTVSVPAIPDWVDVIHVNSWLHARFCGDRARVVTVHHSVHDYSLSAYKTRAQAAYHGLWVRPTEAAAIRRADAVTAVSEYTAAQVRSTFRCPSVEVIHNGIDVDVFRPANRGTRRPGAFRLLYVGSPSRRKGADLLAPIMTLLGKDFVLHYTGAAEAFSAWGGLPANCTALGHLDDAHLVQAMQDADALLFPTRLEGFGMVVAEAMACGLPVVTSRCSSLPEIVEHGESGWLCTAGDIDEFVASLRRLAEDAELRSSMSLAASRRIRNHFTLDRMVATYASLYRRLTSSGDEDLIRSQ